MKICTESNHRYVDEVQSIAQVFFPHARFCSANIAGGGVDFTPPANGTNANRPQSNAGGLPNENPCAAEYTITSIIESECIQAEIFFGVHSLGTNTLRISDCPSFLSGKRLVMLCVYQLLQRTIGAPAPWGALTGVRPTKMIREWLADGYKDDDCARILQDVFYVHKDRVKLSLAVSHAENRLASIITGMPQNPVACGDIAIYVSIPFCPSRCTYCSFNTMHKPWDIKAQAEYINAVMSECHDISSTIRSMGASVSSIYIGGGTPTALADDLLSALLDSIQKTIVSHANASIEYTVEAGRPDTITRNNLRLMQQYGVNRISINPQTFNDRSLEIIGRNHNAQDTLRAFYMAREEGFKCINADIIAGLPSETASDMHHTMEAIAKLSLENITIHTLAVKRASKLNENRAEKHRKQPTSSHSIATSEATGTYNIIKSQLDIAHSACTALGHAPYYLYRQKNMAALFENTGYSLPGHECLYNVGMMSEVQTVLGIGAGAVSKYINGTKITRSFNAKNPEIYIERRQST